MTKKNLRLKKKLETEFKDNGMSVSKEIHNDLATVIERNTSVVDSLPPNSFQRLFWEQQLIALSKSNSKGVRYHPLMIRWCLYLHHHSSGAYNVSVPKTSVCLVYYVLISSFIFAALEREWGSQAPF